MTPQSDWNPDQACEEMAQLFRQADKILKQPHYQQLDTSADELDTRSAGPSQTPMQTT